MNNDTHGSSEEEWIGFDLDGTLASYDGWKGIEHIGKPVDKMVLIAKLLHRIGKKIKVITARVAPREGENDSEKARKHVEKWCKDNLGFVPEITCVKDASMAALFDDRAVAVEQNTGKVLGGWPDALPKASGNAKNANPKAEKKASLDIHERLIRLVMRRNPGFDRREAESYVSDGRLDREISEKLAAERPSKEDLWRMYDIIQADARLSNKIRGLGFGGDADAYRRAAVKLKVMELANVIKDGKRMRNRIVHAPGYIPSEMDAKRALEQYAKANSKVDGLLGGKS